MLRVRVELTGPVFVHGVDITKRAFALNPMAHVAVDFDCRPQRSIWRLEIAARLWMEGAGGGYVSMVSAVCVRACVRACARVLECNHDEGVES